MKRPWWGTLGARPLLFPALGFATGSLLNGETGSLAAIFLSTSAALALVSLLISRRSGAHLMVLGGFVALGWGLAGLARRDEGPEPPASEARLEGEIESVRRFESGTQLVLAVARLDEQPARFRARLDAREALALLPGQRVLLPARLRAIEGPDNWGQPDWASAQHRRALRWRGSFEAQRLVVLSPPSALQRWLHRTHAELARRVEARAPSPEAAALYLTLAAGERARLGARWEEIFSRSGLAHVLSVSGLHVAALALLVFRLLRWLLVRSGRWAQTLEAGRAAAAFASPLVWGYVAFTGWQPPAVRSAWMASAFLAARVLARRSDALNGLALAALAVGVIDPAALGELSMQLSFLAVGSLILLSPALRALFPAAGESRWSRLVEGGLQTLCASAAVTLVGLPLVAEAFGQVSLAGLISNVICLPLCALLTVLAAGGAGLSAVWSPLAEPLLWAGGWAARLLLWLAERFAALPGAALEVAGFGASIAALFWLGLLLFALARGPWRWGGALVPLALLWVVLRPAVLSSSELEVTFLAVGHGDAILLSSGGKHALVDGGGVPGGADPGARVVLPYLRARGVKRLQLATLSHPHPDHALGLATVLERIPAERLWLAAGTAGGELSRRVVQAARGAVLEEVDAGRAPLRLGEAELEVLGPPRDRLLLEGVNDRSVVLRVRHREVTFLLTGDVEEAGEALLDPGPVTVLKAPHHGSRTSSSEAFVTRVRPRHVVFCVGRDHRFGFPHAEVEERYRAAGARCHRTDWQGAIRFRSDGREVKVETFRTSPPAVARRPGRGQLAR
jgi:competence protein ComEC